MNQLRVYELRDDVDRYPGFLEVSERDDSDPTAWTELMSMRTIQQGDKPFGADYVPVRLEFSNEGRKKNSVGDICLSMKPFIILSKKARLALNELLAPVGEFLEVAAPVPDFVGYRLLDRLAGCVDLERSSYSKTDEGKILVRKPSLYGSKVQDQHIFAIMESPTGLFVSDVFRTAVEKEKLKGFDFTREIPLV